MKKLKNIKLLAGLISVVGAVVWLTGCGGSGGGGGTTNTGGTNAPASIAGRSITHNITSGTAPLPTHGSFVVAAGGADGDVTGNYTITGSGGVTNSSGTYTYTMTDINAATLHLEDSVFGPIDEALTFTGPRTGTSSSTSGSGGTQSGTFITN